MSETSKSKEAERRLDQSPGNIAAVEFLKKVHCHFDKDEDTYIIRYFDFIAGFNENKSRLTQLETEKAQAEGRVKELERTLNEIAVMFPAELAGKMAASSLNK